MKSKKVERTASGLRDALFDQLDGLNAKKVTHQEARAFASVTANILKSVEVQLKFQQMHKDGMAPTLAPMKLVTDAPAI